MSPRNVSGPDLDAAGRATVSPLARAWLIPGLVIFLPEIFMRLDSGALSMATKVWFLPVLLLTLVAVMMVGAEILHRLFLRLTGPRWATRLDGLLLAGFPAAGTAGQFVGVAHYHAPAYSFLWPVIAAGGALVGILSYRTCLAGSDGEAVIDARSLGRRIAAPAAVVVAGGLLLSPALAGTRADLSMCLVRRNTVVGRLAGFALAASDPILPPQRGDGVERPPLRSARKLDAGNIVLLSIDTLRADALGPYGASPDMTPRLTELGERSVVFDDAFVSQPLSAPSLATVHTGLYPANHGVRRNTDQLPETVVTLAEVFQEKGYATGAFVGNWVVSEDFNFDQGFDVFKYVASKPDADGLLTASGDPQVVDAALDWVRAQAASQLFLWIHLVAPHSPYLPPGDGVPVPPSAGFRPFNVFNMSASLAQLAGRRTSFDLAEYLKYYRAEVGSADRDVGRALDGLRHLGALADAQVIFLADHGEAFGEGDSFGHGDGLEPSQSWVPLFWRLPGDQRAGARERTTVQLADVFPTVLDVIGDHAAAPVDGRVLSAVLLGEQAGDDGFAFTEAGWIGQFGSRGIRYAARTRRRTVWLDTAFGRALSFDRTTNRSEVIPRRSASSADEPLLDTVIGLARESDEGRWAKADTPPLRELSAAEREHLRALGYAP
jgi:hypothetical protein